VRQGSRSKNKSHLVDMSLPAEERRAKKRAKRKRSGPEGETGIMTHSSGGKKRKYRRQGEKMHQRNRGRNTSQVPPGAAAIHSPCTV
jgi:hypothetical protein